MTTADGIELRGQAREHEVDLNLLLRGLEAAMIPRADVPAFCRARGWTVVGYDLALLGRDDKPVRVAVLVIDERYHFLAVSTVALEGEVGIGIIDLTTAEARFARAAAHGPRLRN